MTQHIDNAIDSDSIALLAEGDGSNKGDDGNRNPFDPFGGNMSRDPRGPRRPGRMSWIYFVIACALMAYLFFNLGSGFGKSATSTKLATSQMVTAVTENRVQTMTYTVADGSIEGKYWVSKDDRGKSSRLKSFTSTYAGSDSLAELMAKHPKTTYIVNNNDPDFWGDLAMTVLPTLVLVLIMFYFMRQMMGANSKTMQFGKTNAKTNEATRPKVKFSDVAGIDEAVEELEEIRDFLTEPERYRKLGAKIPRGCLLVGPPGTGKTLLAKAVAGEAGVPFFSISGSEFVEMFVGRGAAKVRDLFKQAKEKAPCIVFIDEIDTIGKKRDGGGFSGNDEREQTLNQLLTEMDGFDNHKGIVVLAATNRPDSLDPALLRPGRFDRRIPVELPDLTGRKNILELHAKSVKIQPPVDLTAIARATPGASGADLANIINEGALRAVREGRKRATQEDFEESVEVVIAGQQRKSTVLSDHEKQIVSYHEIGHAIVAARQKGSAPVTKITIVPRTSGALGYTMQVEEDERFLTTRQEVLDKLAVYCGGRAAEELIFGEMTTGAANDIEQATKLARNMVTRFGMSDEFGMMALGTVQNAYLNQDTSLTCAPGTAERVDEIVAKLLEDAHSRALQILKENKFKLHELARYLYKKETITGEEFMSLLSRENPLMPKQPAE